MVYLTIDTHTKYTISSVLVKQQIYLISPKWPVFIGQLEEERQAEVDHENRLLLQKMSRIMKEPALVDSWNDYQSKRLTASFTIWSTCTWTESILQNGFSLQCKLRLWSSFVLFYWLSWFCFMVVI